MRFTAILVLFAGVRLLSEGRASESVLTVDRTLSHIEIGVHATVDSFVGKLNAYEPEVAVNDAGEITRTRLAFHFRDVSTAKESRDKSMHRWQHTDQFPDGVFTLTNIERRPDGPATAFGRLAFHGVTRDVRFPIAIAREGRRYVIDGDVALDTRDYGLPVIRMLGLLKVDPVVHVRFHLQASRETSAP
jgi:polyisoprenoid-binding protein YceI